jgi:hypothetical protein
VVEIAQLGGRCLGGEGTLMPMHRCKLVFIISWLVVLSYVTVGVANIASSHVLLKLSTNNLDDWEYTVFSYFYRTREEFHILQ